MKNEKIMLLVDIWIQSILISVGVWILVLLREDYYSLLLLPFYQVFISANLHFFMRQNLPKAMKFSRKIHITFSWGLIMMCIFFFYISFIWKQLLYFQSIFIFVFISLFQFSLCVYYFFLCIQDYKS